MIVEVAFLPYAIGFSFCICTLKKVLKKDGKAVDFFKEMG